MSKKVLILGCSLTQGSYARDEKSSIKESIVSSYGWYDSLKCLKDLEIDVFAYGGGGYTTFAETLNDLHSNGKLKDYSMLIIQETSEPRFVLRKQDFSWREDSSKEIEGRELNKTQVCFFYPSAICIFKESYYLGRYMRTSLWNPILTN